jgi:hypothetical protein
MPKKSGRRTDAPRLITPLSDGTLPTNPLQQTPNVANEINLKAPRKQRPAPMHAHRRNGKSR